MTVIERSSGYVADPAQWVDFLSCWYSVGMRRHQELLRETPDLPYLPILSKYARPHTEQQSVDAVRAAIDKLEKTLGLALPKSYKDFLIAYQPPVLEPVPVPGGTTMIGMYAPSQVNRVATLVPYLAELAEKYPIEKSDKEYFIYGAKQDDVHARTRYIADAIIVGRHGDAMHDIVVLYPQVRTADGEMEAALHFHSGEFRAPSFAELMRQLSILETKKVDRVPPYPQTALKGTCADKLPLVDVWWE
nr:SMI1/KNR4 family protein [Rhodoferax sp.]